MAGRHGVPNLAAYAATKAALNVFSESVAGEVRNDNIKISVLAPGSTDTTFGSGSRRESSRSSTGKKMLTAQEVAEAAVFLARQNENAWSSMVDIRPLVIKR
jgi:short-subunit dehydrogenase